MFALRSRYLRRRLSGPSSGSARRRARERRQAEQTRMEGERLARQRREQKYREKIEQQRIAREQLASYEPWGRAGGGAPNPCGTRYSNLRASGIYPEDELRGTNPYEACHRWVSPRRLRRRTPLRLREDPQTLYTDTLRKSVDNDIRYRQTPDQQKCYKEVLDDMVSQKNKAMKDEIKRNRDYERKIQTLDGPWGKPGPGGTTWRNPRDIGFNFSNSMGWTDNEAFNKIKGDHNRHKRSSLTLPKVKKDDDSKDDVTPNKENIKPSSVEKLPDIENSNSASREHKIKSICDKKDAEKTKEDHLQVDKNKDPKQAEKTKSHKLEKTRNANTLADKTKDKQANKTKDESVKSEPPKDTNTQTNNSKDHSRKQPEKKDAHVLKEIQCKENEQANGSKKKSPKKGKFIKRLTNGERLKRIVPGEEYEDNNSDSNGEKKLTPEATILRLTGGIELVPLLARRRRVGARTLPSSDVTRPPEQYCQWRESLHAEYLRELKKQMQTKCAQKEVQVSRQLSAESVRKHHETWDSLWGRPGHGAPLRGKYARSNLAQLLYLAPLAHVS